MFKRNKSSKQGMGAQRASNKVSPKIVIIILMIVAILGLLWWAVSLLMAPEPQKKARPRTPMPAPVAAPAPTPAPAPVAAPEVGRVAPDEGEGQFAETHTIYFKYRSYYVNGVERKEIRKFLARLETLKGLQFQVDAYTDNSGRKSYNKYLSKRRARSVRDYLIKRGVPRSVISIAYHGEKSPAASNSKESGRKQNRRVVLTVSPTE